jgi:hypothetical protein
VNERNIMTNETYIRLLLDVGAAGYASITGSVHYAQVEFAGHPFETYFLKHGYLHGLAKKNCSQA